MRQLAENPMQILILDDDPGLSARLSRALVARGFAVSAFDGLAAAEAAVRLGGLDLLILAEELGGRLTHGLALLAGCSAPPVPTIFLSARQGPAAAELFDLIPTAVSLAGRDALPDTIAEVAASVLNGATLAGVGLGARVVPVPSHGPVGQGGPQPVPVSPVPASPSPASRAERAAALAHLPAPRRTLALA